MKKIIILQLFLTMLFQACSDEPQSYDEPVLISNTTNKASAVFMTADTEGKPIISWVETDSAAVKHFYFAVWDTRKQSFGQPVPIPIAQNAGLHEEGMPKLAVKADGTMIATFETSVPWEKSRFGLSDIQYVSSTNQGKSWTRQRSIQEGVPHVGSRSFGNIARLADGELGVTWLDAGGDDSGGGRPVKFAKTQGKNGFGPAILIEPKACECCRTSLSSDSEGKVNVVFRDLLPGTVRDISVSRSTDNGESFGKPTPFSNDHWVLDGCPHNGPSIVSSKDKSFVTWYTGSDRNGVFYAELDRNGAMRNKRSLDANGRFAQITLLPDGTPLVALSVNYGEGDRGYSKIVANLITGDTVREMEISEPHTMANYPVLQAVGYKSAVIAWTDEGKVKYRLINTDRITAAKTEHSTAGVDAAPKIVIPPLSVDHDPVCGMKVTERTAVDFVHFKNKNIGFCSESCKRKFVEKPGSYNIDR